MRRTSALLAAVAFAAIALAGAASADASPAVDRHAWARTGPLAPTDPSADAVYVSAAGGQEQARAFVHVDTAGLAAEEIVRSSVVLAPAPDGVVAEQASMIACSLTTALAASGELETPPASDCSVRADVERGDDGTWILPLAVFAENWAIGDNQGVAIIPSPDAAASVFTVSFDTTKTTVDAPVPDAAPATPSTTEAATTMSDAVTAPATLDVGPPPEVVVPSASTEVAPASEPVILAAAPRAVERAGRWASHPTSLLVVVPVLLAAALLWARSRRPRRLLPETVAVPSGTMRAVAAWVAVPLVLMTFGETTIYKIGLVAIAFIAAVGLHLLVNWTGELSLAHAGFIGVPAFAVAQFSANTGLTPILGLPLAVAVGVALGAVVGIAALRSRGLQVALVTLAFGIAVGQFLFFRTWVVGPPGGLQMPVPSLFGLEVRTSRALVPVLVVAVLLAVLAAKSIMRSKVGRALLLVRSDPDAAAAAGVAVARHRALAYALAGAFAGLAGWSYVVWVQQVSAKAFPLQLGFTYLVIAALAGSGGLAGVVAAAALIQGGALFSIVPHSVALYLAPVALIVNVTRYQEGFNGVLRLTSSALRSRMGATMRGKEVQELRLQVVFGTLAVVAGFAAIGLAWFHMGNTDAVWVQNQELMSGGVTGLGLIVLGATLLLRDALLHGHTAPSGPHDEHASLELAPPVATTNGLRDRRKVPVNAG